MLAVIWTAVILAALVLYFRQRYSRFSKYGVKHLTPIPLVGTIGRVVAQMEHFVDDFDRIYNTFPKDRFVGRYDFLHPSVVIKDIDLVKQITVKDFEHFVDHRSFVDDKNDPFFGRNLLALKGQEWKDMRSTLSPAFTSSKIRHMLPFMVDVGNEMMVIFKNKIKESKVNYIDVEGKDLATRYANDVIASCAFGLKVNSHADENNEFYKMGRETSTFKLLQILKFLLFLSFPEIMTKLKLTLFKKTCTDFFKKLVLSTMRHREEKNIMRPDMIHLLMEAKKGKLFHDDKSRKDADAGFATVEESSIGKNEINREWSDNDLIAQAMLFLIAGFETVSSAMSFALHELAVNPDVQEKLAQEIKENEIKNGGKLDYKSIQDMTYMDMVVSEVLRLWPPAVALDRVCIKDYNLGKPNPNANEDYIIRKGEGLNIPVWSIHHDPNHFPDPLKFDPERFSEDNKNNIKPFTYLPFGLGPRNCIGSRFALCEVKVMIYQMLQHMVISPCEKTCIPAQLYVNSANLTIKGGHWIRLQVRN